MDDKGLFHFLDCCNDFPENLLLFFLGAVFEAVIKAAFADGENFFFIFCDEGKFLVDVDRFDCAGKICSGCNRIERVDAECRIENVRIALCLF